MLSKEQTSGQKSSFMHELDAWTEAEILTPLGEAWLAYSQAGEGAQALEMRTRVDEIQETVKARVRAKVLLSFRNGQRTKQKTGSKEGGQYGR